jgi:hypothetical protein
VATWLDFSVKISETDSPAFPIVGLEARVALCEDASVAQNDGLSQDGMTCTVIPTVLRALPCCCTVVAHGWADWKRASSLRIILYAPAGPYGIWFWHLTVFISLLVDRSCASLLI